LHRPAQIETNPHTGPSSPRSRFDRNSKQERCHDLCHISPSPLSSLADSGSDSDSDSNSDSDSGNFWDFRSRDKEHIVRILHVQEIWHRQNLNAEATPEAWPLMTTTRALVLLSALPDFGLRSVAAGGEAERRRSEAQPSLPRRADACVFQVMVACWALGHRWRSAGASGHGLEERRLSGRNGSCGLVGQVRS
jgi:hypothetical protein